MSHKTQPGINKVSHLGLQKTAQNETSLKRVSTCFLFLVFLFSLFSSLSLDAKQAKNTQDKAIADKEVIVSEAATFTIEEIATGFVTPWSLEFLDSSKALLGERDLGKISLLNVQSGEKTNLSGLPEMLVSKKLSAGVFDIKKHPDFDNNGWIYICYSIGESTASGLAVDRFQLDGDKLHNRQQIFRSSERLDNKWHFAGRMSFVENYLYIAVGDGYNNMQLAQDLNSYAGKVLRLDDDGQIPTDNPFVGKENVKQEIWAYGLRNPQGMAVRPNSNEVWTSEHGPQGGDEINVVEAGVNYGWPIITYGEEYGGGPIGEGITRKQGMQQPLYYYRPSIAPSGLGFYSADTFPEWRNSVFMGALKLTHINRLVIEDNRVIHEERLLEDKAWRVRFVQSGPDGYLYFGVDKGMIMRLIPASSTPVTPAGAVVNN